MQFANIVPVVESYLTNSARRVRKRKIKAAVTTTGSGDDSDVEFVEELDNGGGDGGDFGNENEALFPYADNLEEEIDSDVEEPAYVPLIPAPVGLEKDPYPDYPLFVPYNALESEDDEDDFDFA